MKITALLVCHDGARWLPQALAAFDASNRQPDTFVAVDTGSTDDSVALVQGSLWSEVVALDAATSYPAAVRAGLASLPPATDDEWVWLLHDDAAPDPACLGHLVATAESAAPEVAAIGPKLREWPSLKRLLEVGVTISGTGRRETGLEPGEYDQGQHDDVEPVLAVNTAGMLVRRRVLEEVGISDDLPLFGNDIDFGWRLARQGHRVRVDPDAVMFHIEAAHRGQRQGDLAARPRRDERAAAIFTLLVNGSGRAHPYRVLRLLVAGLLRALGFLVVRALGEARDELAAVVHVYGRPGRVLAARRARRRVATVPSRDVRPLLAPFWMPWRHGLDFVVDVLRAIAAVGRESLDRRRGTGVHTGSIPSRFLGSPSAWSLAVATVVALVAGRGLLLHGAPLQGGALWPAPGSVGHWWSTWADSWHWIGHGSSAPAPPYLLPMAVAGTVLFGQPGLVVWLLCCLTVPLAMLGALRFLRRITVGKWAPVWGSVTYALLPVLSGSVSQGRLGTLVAAVVLPWVATATVRLASNDPDHRARGAWRAGLLLGLLALFVPVAVVVGLLLVLLAGALGAPRLSRAQQLTIVGVPVLLLAPWWPELVHAPGVFLVEAGRAATLPVRPDLGHLLAGVSGGPGSAPFWITLGVPLAGLVALVRTDTRALVTRFWVVGLVGSVVLVAVSWVTVSLPGVPADFHPWTGFLRLLVLAAMIAAAVVAADGVGDVVGRSSFGWRQAVAAVGFVAAVLAPLAGGAWWLVQGTPGPLHRGAPQLVPAYMSDVAGVRHDSATMLVRGGPGVPGAPLVEYQVVRAGSQVLGDDGVLALTAPDRSITATMSRLVGNDPSAVAPSLAAHGIAYVFAPAPVSPAVAGALDAADGFSSASAPNPRTRAWRVVVPTSTSAVDSSGSLVHPWLLAVEVLTVLAGIVLALPSRRQL